VGSCFLIRSLVFSAHERKAGRTLQHARAIIRTGVLGHVAEGGDDAEDDVGDLRRYPADQMALLLDLQPVRNVRLCARVSPWSSGEVTKQYVPRRG
jgi:hypothetical protein